MGDKLSSLACCGPDSDEKLTMNTTYKLTNGVDMPLFGFGTWRGGDVKLDERKDVGEACDWAFKAGYRHIDTASYYENEAEIGNWMKANNIDRKSLFITSKIWND